MPADDQVTRDLLFQTILDRASHAIIFVDAAANIRLWNRAAETIFGWDSTHVAGTNLFEHLAPAQQLDHEMANFLQAQQTTAQQQTEKQLCRSDGTNIWCDLTISFFKLDQQTWAYYEIRDARPRKRRELELRLAATTDELSQLLNRRGFQEQLDSNLNRPLTLAIIDIDHLKQLNDRCGHEMGDQAIRLIADRLRAHFCDAIGLARLGGDEFGVILSTVDSTTLLQTFESFQASLQTTELTCPLSVSIGIARANQTAISASKLLATADHAMYQSKRQGRNCTTLKQIEGKL